MSIVGSLICWYYVVVCPSANSGHSEVIDTMKKRSPVVLLVVIIICLAATLMWWFWSMGRLPADSPSKLHLAIVKGSVFVTKEGAPEEQAKSGMEVYSGDRIRTGESSAASVMSYGKADIRLDSQTSMVITEAQDGIDSSFVMNWKLESGRIWSRILHLLDLRDDFKGQSNQVIATVRGTAFGMVANGQTVDLIADQAGISVMDGQNNGNKNYLVGGEWVQFDSNNRLIGRGDVSSSTWRDNAWIKENREADNKYAASAELSFIESLNAKNGVPPDHWSYSLSLWSEDAHLVFAGKNKEKLWARYFGRRIGYVHDLIGRGKSGLAFQMLSEIDKELNSKLTDTKSKENRQAIRPVLGKAMLALSSIDPGNNLFRLKLGVEDMYARAWDDDEAASFYARSLSVDARLDEAERFDCQPNVEDLVKEAVNAVTQGLARENNDFDQIASSLTVADRTELSAKLQIQTLRLDFFKRHLEMCTKTAQTSADGVETATSTSQATTTGDVVRPTQTTSTTPTKPPVIATTTQSPQQTQPVVQTLGLTRIELFAQPSPANVGDRVKLFVNGYKADGSMVDVTSRATFKLVGSLGSLSGATYIASTAGSVTIQATAVDSGKTFTSSVSLVINQGVTLTSISLSPASGSINTNGSLPLSVVANYSNGFSKEISSSVQWSVSNSLARMAGTSLVAGNTAGTVTVTASYSDLGTTKTTVGNYQIIQSPTGATFLQ